MNQETTLHAVQEICLKLLRVPPEKVVPGALLIEDLEMDSLFAAELGLALERHFKIEVPEETIPKFKTIADVAAYVDEKLNASTA